MSSEESETYSDTERECMLYSQLYFANPDGINDEHISVEPHSDASQIKNQIPSSMGHLSTCNVSQRRRNSSICSNGSISGKQPLDELYCNAWDDLSVIEEEDVVSTRKMPISSRTSISRPISKYDMNCSKFVKEPIFHPPKCVVELSRSSSEEVIYVPPPVANYSSDIEVLSDSDDSSILCLEDNSKVMCKSKIASTCQNVPSSSSSDEDDEIDIPSNLSLTFNLAKDYQESISPPRKKKATPKKRKREHAMIYSKLKPPTKKKPTCLSWTSEMASFYDSDISDDITVADVHASQSDHSNNWKIINDDRAVKFGNRYFTRESRCKRCRQFGHETNKCSKVLVCSFCGESDHTTFVNCPSRCCLRCGGEPHKFCPFTTFRERCLECGLYGHIAPICPNVWRRFHSTTKGSDPVKVPEQPLHRVPYCFNCSKRGHFGSSCTLFDRNQKYTILPTTAVHYKAPVQSRNKFRAIERNKRIYENGSSNKYNKSSKKKRANMSIQPKEAPISSGPTSKTKKKKKKSKVNNNMQAGILYSGEKKKKKSGEMYQKKASKNTLPLQAGQVQVGDNGIINSWCQKWDGSLSRKSSNLNGWKRRVGTIKDRISHPGIKVTRPFINKKKTKKKKGKNAKGPD